MSDVAAAAGVSRQLRSLTDPNVFLAIEVFADREAFDRQNAQQEIADLLSG